MNNYNRGSDGRHERNHQNQSYHRPYSDHRGENSSRDYTRPEFRDSGAHRGRGLIYQEEGERRGEDPDHYHEYEDEVCMKCDNAQTVKSRERTVSDPTQQQQQQPHVSPRLSRNIEPGCEYDYPSHDQFPPSPAPSGNMRPAHPRTPPTRPHMYPPPPHVTHVSYPGYPSVSVQDYTRPGYYDDHPYYQPRPYMQPRFLPHVSERRRLPPPPRFGGPPPHRYYRPPFPPMMPPRPPPHVQEWSGVEVTMRHPEYSGPVRRPVSELTPRHFYTPVQTSRLTDPNSLPRRKLPEIPQQRRLPDTLPRTAKPSYSLEDQYDDYLPDEQHQHQQQQHHQQRQHPLQPQSSLEVPSKHSSSHVSSETKSSNVSRQSERRSPKKSPVKQDDIKTRTVQDRSTKQNITRQSKGSSKSPSRQGIQINIDICFENRSINTECFITTDTKLNAN